MVDTFAPDHSLVHAGYRKLNLAGSNGNKPLKAKPFNPHYSTAYIQSALLTYCNNKPGDDPIEDDRNALFILKALKAVKQAELYLEQNPTDQLTKAWLDELNEQVGEKAAKAFESRHPRYKQGIVECDGWVDLMNWLIIDHIG